MKVNKTNKGTVFIMIGVLLLLAAVALSTYNLYESRKANESSAQIMEMLIAEIQVKTKDKETTDGENIKDKEEAGVIDDPIVEYEKYPDMEMPTITINGELYIGYIEIPALNLTLPVAGGQWSNEKMKSSPCLYRGSAYKNDIIIAGHNYVDQFGRLSNLSTEADVFFTDASGNRFEYTVGWTETVNGTDIEGMVEESGWDLTLFTCNYSGEKRIAVRCILKS